MSSSFSHRSLMVRALVAIVLVFAVACTTPVDETSTPVATATSEATPTSVPKETASSEALAPEIQPSPTPTQLPLPTPSPTATASPAPTAVAPTSMPTTAPTSTPTPTITPTPTSVPVLLNIQIKWAINFPNTITFSMETQSEVPVQHAELIFGYPLAHNCTLDELSSVRIEPDDPNEVDVSWDWEMQRTGSIPPGTLINHRWVITDENGDVFVTDDQEILWEDARFEWSEYTSDNITFYWYDGDTSFGQTLAVAVENRLDRMELGVTLDKPIKAYIYPDAATLREAILFTQAWTGGLAFTSQNILLIAVAPAAEEAEVGRLVHELAHLLVREVTFSCLGDMPTWLDEGLAEYAEGPVNTAHQTALDDALGDGSLITIQSLSSSFPADHSGANLAYTQSKSIVSYLIQEHGWNKMNELLDIFEQGSTYEGALMSVYGLNLQTLDTTWRGWMSTQ